ncbi:protein of unknown function [Burkholderia multivorans]
MPVVDLGNRLVGMLSLGDIATRTDGASREEVANTLERVSQPKQPRRRPARNRGLTLTRATCRPVRATFAPARRTTMNTPAQGQTRIIRKGVETARGPGPDVMAASTLEGDKVLTVDGEDVGRIKEIMLDVMSGRIAYAVLSSGGMLGIGDKLVAIPWSAFTLDAERKCLMLSVSSGQIRNAPGFDKDHWPAMADPQWAGSMQASSSSASYSREGDSLDLDDPLHKASPDYPESGEGRH